MNIPEDLKYTLTHEWVRFEKNGYVHIGLTDWEQSLPGHIVYINLPYTGEFYREGELFADVESMGSGYEVFMPLSGRVVSTNIQLSQRPEMLKEDPYGSWLVEIAGAIGGNLMGAQQYRAYLTYLEGKKAGK
ncbi:MAG: glycine cleavage system protein H [Christensenella sp.]|nr:glycine cleavage system protein H [Christensenella sp.]